MTPLLLLAEKVEGLDGTDREVDAEIALSLGLSGGNMFADRYAPGWCVGGVGQPFLSPRYTDLLDAAMSLVPDGCVLHALGESQSPSDEKRPWLAMVVQRGQSLSTGRTSYSATPALALCAAALRARAAMEAGE